MHCNVRLLQDIGFLNLDCVSFIDFPLDAIYIPCASIHAFLFSVDFEIRFWVIFVFMESRILFANSVDMPRKKLIFFY